MTDVSTVDWSKWTTEDLQAVLAEMEELKNNTAALARGLIEKELKSRKKPTVGSKGVKPSNPDAPKIVDHVKGPELLFRFEALEQQMAASVAKVVEELKSTPPIENPDPLASEQRVEIQTQPHPDAATKQEGPYNLWSGTKDTATTYGGYGGIVDNTGEKQAEDAGGYIMGQTAHHFRAESILTAAEGDPHKYEQDPSYHKTFVEWLEQPITDVDLAAAKLVADRAKFEVAAGTLKARNSLSGDPKGKLWLDSEMVKRKTLKPEANKSWLDDPITDEDLADAGLTPDRAKFVVAAGALKPRTWLLQDPVGKAWVEGELLKMKQAVGVEKDKSAALEVQEGTAPLDPGGHDRLSKGTSEVKNRSKLPTAPDDQVALIGLHDANFHSAWDPTSEDTAVDAVRSFTPVASYGVPGHRNPSATVQATVEIPTIQREAANQKKAFHALADLLMGKFASDPDVVAGSKLLTDGVDAYFDGAMALEIDPALSVNWPPQSDRLAEDLKRKQSVTLMTDGRTSIRDGLAKLKASESYQKKKFS